jgi:hypothetical protein
VTAIQFVLNKGMHKFQEHIRDREKPPTVRWVKLSRGCEPKALFPASRPKDFPLFSTGVFAPFCQLCNPLLECALQSSLIMPNSF